MARILLIDDDELLRKVLRMTLVHFGHTVSEASDGQEGLRLYDKEGADLLITDIIMPEKEGLEVLMSLRNRQPPVKMIAMSGGGRINATDYLALAKRLGADRVLAKPFSNEALLAAIDELLLMK